MNFEEIPVNFGDNYLWKYMDIHKFLYLIREKQIYFTRLDCFDDPNEGVSERLLRILYESGLYQEERLLNHELFPTAESRSNEVSQRKEVHSNALLECKSSQRVQFASCWFQGNRESYAMWNLYSNPESVAIRFKPEPLLRQVERYVQINLSHPCIDVIVCSNVEYRPLFPPEYDEIKYTNPHQRYVGLRKDISYESEKEYRMLAIGYVNAHDYTRFELKLDGLFDLDFKIVTHPKMQPWMRDNIASVLKPYGIEDKLMKSEIRLRNTQ